MRIARPISLAETPSRSARVSSARFSSCGIRTASTFDPVRVRPNFDTSRISGTGASGEFGIAVVLLLHQVQGIRDQRLDLSP